MAARRSLVIVTNVLSSADCSKTRTGRRILNLHSSGSCLGISAVCRWFELDYNVKHGRTQPRLWWFTGTGRLANTLGVSGPHQLINSNSVFARLFWSSPSVYVSTNLTS